MGSRLAMAGICTNNQIWFTMVFGSTMVRYGFLGKTVGFLGDFLPAQSSCTGGAQQRLQQVHQAIEMVR